MFRVAVVAYLSFVALAGPSFCCCTAGKVGAWLASVTRSADVHAPAHACCGAHSKKAHVATRATTDCDFLVGGTGHGDDCSCPELSSEAIVAAPPLDAAKLLDDSGTSLDWPLPSAILPARIAIADGRSTRGHPCASAFVHLSGQEILRALQRFLL
jgi:hypothetical protein